MFYGDGRADENPYDFLKLLQTSFGNTPGITDKDKCERFYLNCKSDFDAEEWYDALPAVTKTTWSALATAFRIRWPKRVKIQKTPEQKKAELFAQRLDEERMLEKEIIGGAPVYAYIAWAECVNMLSIALGDTQGFLISVIHDMLPKALRNVIGTSHDTWPVFITAVRAVSPTVLQSAIDDENRLRSLEASQALLQSPTAAIRQAFNRATITARPPSPTPTRTLQRLAPPSTNITAQAFAAGTGPRTRLFAYQPNTLAATTAATPKAPLPMSAFRNPRVRLIDLQRNSLQHHPDTEEGRARYQTQVEEWHRRHGAYPQTKPDEYKPYPLTPGTQPVSSDACFNCGGKHGDRKHFQRDCPVKDQPGSVPMPEHAFRAIAAICHGLIQGPQQPAPPAAVRFVDVTDEDDTYIQNLIDGGAFVSEVAEEGKGGGLSN